MPKIIRTAGGRKATGRKPASRRARANAGRHDESAPIEKSLPEDPPLELGPPGDELNEEYDIAHTGEEDQIEDPVQLLARGSPLQDCVHKPSEGIGRDLHFAGSFLAGME